MVLSEIIKKQNNMNSKYKWALLAAVSIIASSFVIFTKNHGSGYSFVVAGDDRVNAKDTVGDPSTANVYHLNRLFKEVAELNPRPEFLFINGDLVMGYTGGDTMRLAHELEEWIKLYKNSPLASTGVKLVTIAGNHETEEKINDSTKLSVAANERTFVRIMKDYIRGSNGPKATGKVPGTDSLMSDQSRLYYSFDYSGDHFVILNTDPVGRDSRVAWRWLSEDLKKARANNARHIFLFGHKPAYSTHYESESALETYKAARDSFWSCLNRYNCDIYFTSHVHLWDSVHPKGSKTWQIVCGNAGAKLSKDWTPSYYGYTLMDVSSDIKVTAMGRDIVSSTYTKPTPEAKTTLRAQFSIRK
jgi:hypothetical protein